MKLTSGDLSSSSSSSSGRPPNRHRPSRHLPSTPSHSSLYSQSTHQQTQEEEEEENQSPSSYDDHTQLSFSSHPLLPTQPPSTYVNIAPLPTFRGASDECPVAHLARFDRACAANNVSTAEMALRIFPATLDAEAALWYELSITPSIPWHDVRAAFLDAYRSTDDSRAALLSIRQAENESVNAYHLRMRWILKKWPENGLPESVLQGVFVDGLREELREWVAPREPETVEEAVGMARAWEKAGGRRKVKVVKCGFCGGLHEEECCEVRRKMKELWMRTRDGKRTAAAVEAEEGSERGITPAASMKRLECRCWKHQCWKRSNSVISVANGNNNLPANAE